MTDNLVDELVGRQPVRLTRWQRFYRAVYRVVNRPLLRDLEEAERRVVQPAVDRERWSVQADERGIDIKVQGDIATAIAATMIRMYRDGQTGPYAKDNYVALHVREPGTLEEFVLTVQRKRGKTPDELKREAEAERDRLRKVIRLVSNHAWIIGTAFNYATRDFGWQVNVADGEPDKRTGTQRYKALRETFAPSAWEAGLKGLDHLTGTEDDT